MDTHTTAAPVYLDHNATTPVDPTVLEAMLPYLRRHFGNPSSRHPYGARARRAVEEARRRLARLVGAEPGEVVFTGSGSEANNLAIKGVAWAAGRKGHFITSAVEHPAVLEPMRFLERRGHRLTVVGVDAHGRVDPADVEAELAGDTLLVSIMHANNEVGTIQPIAEIAECVRTRGVLMHTDAAQSVGKIPVDAGALGVDLLTVAGHKLYAPKGVGALVVRRGIGLEPLVHGAGHEDGRRAGTENTPYVVGLGRAAELAASHIPTYGASVRDLRDRLQTLIAELVPEAVLNGHPTERLPNTLNLSFPGVDAAVLMERLQGRVACSTGSACHSGRADPSPVLAAMGASLARATSAVRLSLGVGTTERDVHEAAKAIGDAVATDGEDS